MSVTQRLFACALVVLSASAQELPKMIGFHDAVYGAQGTLQPWTPWRDALAREMAWYLNCPADPHGYPRFVSATFLGGDYQFTRMDSIPCTQNGMGIISYLKYWEFTGKKDDRVIACARKMGDYLVNETLTSRNGKWPHFTRSTGYYMDFPLTRSSQGDVPFGKDVIEPDKGGIAGYALLKLYEATGDRRYFNQAKHNADVLVKNMQVGDSTRAPWPFRVDAVTGKHFDERNGNMVYILRLLDGLSAKGFKKYDRPRTALWHWIKTFQIPAPDDPERNLWVNFFEDYYLANNRNSWSPLETARYLIERKEALDPEWKQDAEKLIQFALRNFSAPRPGGVTAMGEQDDDHDPWGGGCSKLGGVAAMFYAAGGGEQYKAIAFGNLTWVSYFIDNDGCPSQKADGVRPRRGGWQEDCHTDVIHNFMDAIAAVPEWGK